MNFVAKAAAVAGLLLSVALPADAAVTFNFNQVGPFQHPPTDFPIPNYTLLGSLTASDAVENGFAFQISNTTSASVAVSPGISNLLALDLTAPENEKVAFSRADFFSFKGFGPGGPYALLDVTGSLMTGLFGSLDYNNAEFEVHYDFTGTSFTATYGADFNFGCSQPMCSFAGTIATSQTPTAVPEPASLALFGMGLAGLGLIRRKRAA